MSASDASAGNTSNDREGKDNGAGGGTSNPSTSTSSTSGEVEYANIVEAKSKGYKGWVEATVLVRNTVGSEITLRFDKPFGGDIRTSIDYCPAWTKADERAWVYLDSDGDPSPVNNEGTYMKEDPFAGKMD